MAGEEEADRLVFAPEPFGGRPRFGARPDRRRGLGFAEQAALAGLALVGGAMGHRQHRLDRGEGDGAVGLQFVEGAGGGEVLERLLVDRARVDAARQIGERSEPPRPARFDQRRRLAFADALDRAQRIGDRQDAAGMFAHVEVDVGAVDRRRRDADAEPLRLGAELGELVGVRLVERHRGGEELGGMVGLEPGGPVGDQRVGRRVALVEAVVGEARQQVEDLVGQRLGQAARLRAADEARALGVHLRLDLLAHRAAQHVGFAERIARQLARDLHHLFLVDDDAEGLAQDRLDLGVDVVGLLVAELARAIGRDVRHRAGAIERVEGDEVLEAVGAHLGQRLAHAGAFNLEHADRLAAAEHLEGLGVLEPDLAEFDLDRRAAPAGSGVLRRVVSVFRPRKSNFTSPAASTHFMLNWVAGIDALGSR